MSKRKISTFQDEGRNNYGFIQQEGKVNSDYVRKKEACGTSLQTIKKDFLISVINAETYRLLKTMDVNTKTTYCYNVKNINHQVLM